MSSYKQITAPSPGTYVCLLNTIFDPGAPSVGEIYKYWNSERFYQIKRCKHIS